MKRRTLLIGLGGIAGAGGAVGSGAFTSVSARRDLEVQIADDDEALLAMEPSGGPNGEFATLSDGTVALDFSGTDAGGEGVGVDSVYDFDDVFRITNQGTQTVYVWVTFDFAGSSLDRESLWLYPDSNPETRLNDGDNSVVGLPVGETLTVGVHVETDALSQDQSLTATVHADVDKPDDSGATDVVGGDFVVVTENPSESNEYGSLQAAIDDVSGSTVQVEPGTYTELAEGRSAYGSTGEPYSFGLFVDVDDLTIVGVDENGSPITDPDDVRAEIVSGASSPFGTNGAFVAADGVTIQGLELTSNPEADPNKDVEVAGDGFTLRHSVVTPNPGGTGVYLNESDVQSFALEGNRIGGGVAVNNGAGDASPDANRVVRDNVLSQVSFQGAIDHVPWLNAAVGGARIEGNRFTGTEDPPISAVGTLSGAPWPWETWLTDNAFENGGVLAWTGSAARSGTRSFTADYDGDGEDETVTYPVRRIGFEIGPELDRAASGDAVLVAPGTYDEDPVVDTPDLTLRGVTDPLGGNAATVDGTLTVEAAGAAVRRLRLAPSRTFEPGGIDPTVLLVTGDDVTVEGNLLEGLRADAGTGGDSVTLNGIHVFDASDSPLGGVVVRDNTVRDVVNDGDAAAGWPNYGGATAIKVQGTVDGVDVVGNTVEEIYSAGWTWGVVLTHTNTGDYDGVSPKSVSVEGNTVSNLNTAGSRFDPLGDPGGAPFPGVAFGIDGNADADQASVEGNNFVRVPLGVQTKDPDHTLDVRNNWWGDASGPGTLAGATAVDPVTDPATGAVADGSGTAISIAVEGGAVRFDPWSSGSN
jgi:hypothetical protein